MPQDGSAARKIETPAAGYKKVVILAEDDESLRETLKTLMEGRGYTIIPVSGGLDGLSALKNNPQVAFVVSDVKMAAGDGIDFLKHASAIRKVPFILMTGFSELLDMPQAYAMGASEFVAKPFSVDDFLSCIDLVEHELKRKDDNEARTPDSEYCRVHVDEFISGSKVNADIFLKLGADKYLRAAKNDSPMAIDRIQSYKRKGLEYFYIKREDFAAYIGMSKTLSQVVTKRRDIPKRQKLAILKHTLENCLQDAYVNDFDKAKYETAKGLVENTLNLAVSQDDLFTLLETLKKTSDRTYAHSMAVALYSMAVAQEYGWTSPSTLNRICMAAMFHDIGKKEISAEIWDKPRMDLTTEEVLLMESHTIRGKDILSRIPAIPEEVVRVAAEHHENQTGRGYPYRLTRMRVHPLATLIGTVNEFTDLVLTPKDKNGMTAHQALQHIYDYKKEEVNKHFLKALMTLFKFPLPKDLAGLVSPKI